MTGMVESRIGGHTVYSTICAVGSLDHPRGGAALHSNEAKYYAPGALEDSPV